MANQIRKVFRRSYDKLSSSDYSIGSDNLNPLRDSDFDQQITEIINACHNKLNNVKKKYKEVLQIEDDPIISNPTIEGMNNEINDLLSKLSKNPIRQLQTLGIDPSALINNPELEQLGHPIIMDCDGIETVGGLKPGDLSIDFLDNEEDNIYGDEFSKEDSDKEYNIKYVLNGATYPDQNIVNSWPKTYTMKSCPFELSNDIIFDPPNIFQGWYLDEYYNQKVAKNKFVGYNRDVTLYAKSIFFQENTPTPLVVNGNPLPPEDSTRPQDCAKQELVWLKTILTVLNIIDSLTKVVTTTLSIVVPTINITKEAVTAWINPTNYASVINRVTQKLISILFSIIAALLMKLWALLDFDCLSNASATMLASIDALLSGISSSFGAVDELACTMDGLTGINWEEMSKQFNDELNEGRAKMNEMFNPYYSKSYRNSDGEIFIKRKDENPDYLFKGALDQLQKLGDDFNWENIKSNPTKLYNQAIPIEIRNDLQNLISLGTTGYNTILGSINTVKNTIAAFQGVKTKINEAKGVANSPIEPTDMDEPTIDENPGKLEASTDLMIGR